MTYKMSFQMRGTMFLSVTMARNSFLEHLEVTLVAVTTDVTNFDRVLLS